MDIIKLATRQPITIAVGVIFIFLAGLVTFQAVPIQMTPEVDDTVIAVTTRWENANPQEIESEVVDPQEEKLQGLANLESISSTSQLGSGLIRLQFSPGVDKNIALREVSDKLREVPSYPADVDEPVIEASDPESKDYIAWYILTTDSTSFDIRRLFDFADKRLKPQLERIPGISEVNILGGQEREAHILFDAQKLAQHHMTLTEFINSLRAINQNFSGGALARGKSDVRVRAVGRFSTPEQILNTVIRRDADGPVYVRDVARVKESFKENNSFVRRKGKTSLAFNFQKEPGSNVLDIMEALEERVKVISLPGGLLDNEAKRLGIEEGFELIITYDSTVYIKQAIALVNDNLLVGSGLAVIVLLLFLRSIRSVGIITLAIPVSMVGTVICMFVFGRTVNVISLAGMAFAVGMVVDNSIVVLENIYRHLEMGKKRFEAAYDGTREVAGAVLASTLTTVVVFLPILLITDQAGQLFRDIALAIMSAVALSYIVSITLIPSASAIILKAGKKAGAVHHEKKKGLIERFIYAINGSLLLRLIVLVTFVCISLIGSFKLMPPLDYLPTGNRNMTFGLMIPPPGYNLDQLSELGDRIEETTRPFWEGHENRQAYPMPYDPSGRTVVAPPLDEYFLVSHGGIIFQGGVSSDPARASDNKALLSAASNPVALPGVFGFVFQFPLFNTGGSSGSAIKINLAGAQLDSVTASSTALFMELMQNFGPASVRPDPANFMVNSPELRLVPDHLKLAESGLNSSDLGLALTAGSDGVILGDYEKDGELIDLKVLSNKSADQHYISSLPELPLSTKNGSIVPLDKLADFQWIDAADQIKRVGRQRAVTLEFTPPAGMPLEAAVEQVKVKIEQLRNTGAIAPGIDINLQGSAGKLRQIKEALIGNGSLVGLLGSSLFLAFFAVYLLLCVLFQSWTQPLIIMFSVPLATFGGFLGLSMVHNVSLKNPYLPVQNMDVLTILGFVILAGVVVNNAILIVAQTKNLLDNEGLDPRTAIAKAVQSRVRPIFMSTLTSVGGMLPLVLSPGSGSELYRGLGAVVVGGMIVSTLFTLVLIPVMLSLSLSLFKPKKVPKLALAALVMLVLPACKSVDSNAIVKEKELVEIPQKWRGPEAPSKESDLAHWWRSFNDESLNQLIADMRENNLDIQVGFYNLLRSRALLLGADSARLPQFNTQGGYNRQRMSNETIMNFMGSDPYSEWSTGFNMSWELDFFGRLEEGVIAGKFDLLQEEENLKSIHLSIAADTASLYWKIRTLQEQILIAERNIVLQKDNLRFAKARLKAGTSTALDVSEAETLLSASESNLPPLKRDLQISFNALSLLMDQPSGSAQKYFSVTKSVPVIEQHLNNGLPRDLVRRRPDIRAAEAKIHANAARLNIAQAEYLPKFALNGNIGLAAGNAFNVADSNAKTYNFGPSFQWRVLDMGTIESEVLAREAILRQSVLQYKQVVLRAFNEVEDSLQKFHYEKERQVALKKSLASAAQSLKLSKSLYVKGLRDYQSVITSLLNLQQFEQQLTSSNEVQAQALVSLYKALGGGWSQDF